MLSPKALRLESLAVSALTLSACSQFINSTMEPPSPTAEESRVGTQNFSQAQAHSKPILFLRQ